MTFDNFLFCSVFRPVYLRDIWPSNHEIQDFISKYVLKEMFTTVYSSVTVQQNPKFNSSFEFIRVDRL